MDNTEPYMGQCPCLSQMAGRPRRQHASGEQAPHCRSVREASVSDIDALGSRSYRGDTINGEAAYENVHFSDR